MLNAHVCLCLCKDFRQLLEIVYSDYQIAAVAVIDLNHAANITREKIFTPHGFLANLHSSHLVKFTATICNIPAAVIVMISC